MAEKKVVEKRSLEINPGYALGQLAKALTTYEEHPDSATRERARARVSKWTQVFQGVVNGLIAVGTRTPISGVPEWATLEVMTGGFATGSLLAGGAIQGHERDLLAELSIAGADEERRFLNGYFLTDDGISRLQDMLSSKRYEIKVPEEGALLVVAWLLKNEHAEAARKLLDEIGPFFGKLRFYPVPARQPKRFGARVHVQDVSETIDSLNAISRNRQILAQREAIQIWTPLYDRTVSLFLEMSESEPSILKIDDSMDNITSGKSGCPDHSYPEGWKARACALLDEYAEKRKTYRLCRKPERRKENFFQLRAYLRKCIDEPGSLSYGDVDQIRRILACYVRRRGLPESSQCREVRRRQSEQVQAPTHYDVCKVVLSRLKEFPQDSGIEDIGSVIRPVNKKESKRFDIPATISIPESIQSKVERCLTDTVDALVSRGVITSGDTLARVLPQVTSELRAAGITDLGLRQLYAAIYQAFQRRRSLLLLNLESQVKFEEVPWVASIEQFRCEDLSNRDLAKETLKEIAALTITSFPHAIIPNKLLKELRSLAKIANLDLPLVDELAADIFMGNFSAKFLQAGKRAADLLEGTLYESYFAIDYASLKKIPETRKASRGWFHRPTSEASDNFANLCILRAEVKSVGWDFVINGMIIEQQQILTTQNLAVLFAGLHLLEDLRSHMVNLAQLCFRWICRRQQMKSAGGHSRLIVLKNTAYAWRQMIFYLSLISDREVQDFIAWADGHLARQSFEFQGRFAPALKGLRLAAEGRPVEVPGLNARRFLGWAEERHWILGRQDSA